MSRGPTILVVAGERDGCHHFARLADVVVERRTLPAMTCEGRGRRADVIFALRGGAPA